MLTRSKDRFPLGIKKALGIGLAESAVSVQILFLNLLFHPLKLFIEYNNLK